MAMTPPKTNMRYSSNPRKISGRAMSASAPRITPGMEPMPPSTTMASTMADSMKVKDSGLTNFMRAAKKVPATPPNRDLGGIRPRHRRE